MWKRTEEKIAVVILSMAKDLALNARLAFFAALRVTTNGRQGEWNR